MYLSIPPCQKLDAACLLSKPLILSLTDYGSATTTMKAALRVTSIDKHLLGSSRDISRASGLGALGNLSLLLSIVSLLLDLAVGLELLDQISVLPADLVGEAAKDAELSVWSEADNLQRLRDDHALDLVIRLGDALEGLLLHNGKGSNQRSQNQMIEATNDAARANNVPQGASGQSGHEQSCGGACRGPVDAINNHPSAPHCQRNLLVARETTVQTHSAPEDASRRSEVERAAPGVGVGGLVEELVVLDLIPHHCIREATHASNATTNSRVVNPPFSTQTTPPAAPKHTNTKPNTANTTNHPTAPHCARICRSYLQDPEMIISSQRTTTTFCPERSCLATTEASLPKRWPLPSTTTTSWNMCREGR